MTETLVLEARLSPTLLHAEAFLADGLVTLLWHGDQEANDVVITTGGALGSLLGPAGAVYHRLGDTLAGRGVATMRTAPRHPGDLDPCVHDMLVAAALAREYGARRFVTVGHSFGGAVALLAAVALGDAMAGAVTLSTQAGGCEEAEALDGRPVLHVHGDADEVLPSAASGLVQMLTGGRLVVIPGAGHLLSEAADEVHDLIADFVTECFAA